MRMGTRARRGFTLIELLVVILIMALVMAVSTPIFSQLFKFSKLDQAAQTMLSAVRQARTTSLGMCRGISMFMGEDPSNIDFSDLTASDRTLIGQLVPRKGKIELWTVWQRSTYSGGRPWGCAYRYPDRFLGEYNLPEGIRVMGVDYDETLPAANPNKNSLYYRALNFAWDGNTPFHPGDWEVQRRQIIYDDTGRLVFGSGLSSGEGPPKCILVYDEQSGENLLIDLNKRPQITLRNAAKVGFWAKQQSLLLKEDRAKLGALMTSYYVKFRKP
jgi:prepilin-type N-terminal cleavage/methylation domain-containing protein